MWINVPTRPHVLILRQAPGSAEGYAEGEQHEDRSGDVRESLILSLSKDDLGEV